jgi:V/A-type H+-transporting ATPase subunit B
MGFQLSEWDRKLLEYGRRFESEMMDLRVNIPLEQALDRGWTLLSDIFNQEEVGVPSDLARQFWPFEEGSRTSKDAGR